MAGQDEAHEIPERVGARESCSSDPFGASVAVAVDLDDGRVDPGVSDAIEQKLEDVIDRVPWGSEDHPLIASTVHVALATAPDALTQKGSRRVRGRAWSGK